MNTKSNLYDVDIHEGLKQAFSIKPAIPITMLSEPKPIKFFSAKVFSENEFAKLVKDLVASGDSIYTENVVRALKGQGLSDSQISLVFEYGIKHLYFIFNKTYSIIKSKSNINSSSTTSSESISPLVSEPSLVEEKLAYSKRERLSDSAFAWPEKRKYPVIDASHVKNAMARLNAEHNKGNISKKDYSYVRKNILAAYLKFGIKPKKIKKAIVRKAIVRKASIKKAPETKMAAESNVYDIVRKRGSKSSNKTRWI